MAAHRDSTPRDLRGLPKLTHQEIDALEASNGLRQFDRVVDLVKQAFEAGSRLEMRPAIIKELNGIAVDGLQPKAGEYREGEVSITGTDHRPPPANNVPHLVDEMCEYYNKHSGGDDPLQLAAYLMWRINWIHPFEDGNGRTSRAVSYLALSVGLGVELPGVNTVPDQIASNKQPYYDALEAADAAFSSGRIDVSRMAELILECLKVQVAGADPQRT